jgi:hypothetical protein
MRDGFPRRGEPAGRRVLRWVWTGTNEEAASVALTGSLEGGSQFEAPYERALGQAGKIRPRISGPGWESLDDPFPPKPKRMRWATYDRIAQRYEGYEATVDARLIGFIGKLLAR